MIKMNTNQVEIKDEQKEDLLNQINADENKLLELMANKPTLFKVGASMVHLIKLFFSSYRHIAALQIDHRRLEEEVLVLRKSITKMKKDTN